MSEEQPLKGSAVMPIQCLVDPRKHLAEIFEIDQDLIQVISVQTLNPDEIKVRFIIK